MLNLRALLSGCVAGVLMLSTAGLSPAKAVTFGFTNITNNGPPNLGGQLVLDVTNAGGGQVSFAFSNNGPIDSTIEQVFFQYPSSLLSSPVLPAPIPNVLEFATVPGSPTFPGGNGPPYNFITSYSAAAVPPPTKNGIDQGESLAILFTGNFANVITAMLDGSLRIGLHVISINNGASDSYLSATPLPGALPLFATGVFSLGLLRRWRKRRDRMEGGFTPSFPRATG